MTQHHWTTDLLLLADCLRSLQWTSLQADAARGPHPVSKVLGDVRMALIGQEVQGKFGLFKVKTIDEPASKDQELPGMVACVQGMASCSSDLNYSLHAKNPTVKVDACSWIADSIHCLHASCHPLRKCTSHGPNIMIWTGNQFEITWFITNPFVAGSGLVVAPCIPHA